MSVAPAESGPSSELLPESEFLKLLNGLSTNELVLLTLAEICAKPGNFLIRSELFINIKDRLDDRKPWFVEKVPGDYCDDKLGPVAEVIETSSIDNGRVSYRAYRANETGFTDGLAMAGALMDWSLRYPNIPLKAIFGSSGSLQANKTPEIRWRVLTELLRRSGESFSPEEVLKEMDMESENAADIRIHLNQLTTNQVLEIQVEEDELQRAISRVEPIPFKYKVRSELTEALGDLLSTLTDTRNSGRTKALRLRALEILEDPKLCGILVDKSQNSSVLNETSKEQRLTIRQHVIEILGSGDTPLFAHQILVELVRSGRAVQIEKVQKALRELLQGRNIIVTGEANNGVTSFKVSQYALPKEKPPES